MLMDQMNAYLAQTLFAPTQKAFALMNFPFFVTGADNRYARAASIGRLI